jgi:DNA-binding LacI/PurR family transcriptional regulator
MPATMNDIARAAGVTRQAVAAALNPKGTSKVSEAMRQRILEIVADLNYIPNQAARHLKGVSNHTIGVYGAPYAQVQEQTYFNELSVAFDRHGYNLVTSYGMNEKASGRAIRELLGKRIDGIIITTQYNPLHDSGLSGLVPSVFSPPARIEGADIYIDHAAGAASAAEYLLEKGCRRGIYVAPIFDRNIFGSPNREKYEGLLRAFKRRNRKLDILIMEECLGQADILIRKIREMAPDVIFCSNDYYAGRLVSALVTAGIRVPEEMKVVGYDGLALCDLCAVPLATVIQPIMKRAEASAKLLLKRIKEQDRRAEPADMALAPYFYPSKSCGAENEMLKIFPLHNTYSSLEMTWNENPYPKDLLTYTREQS